MIAADTVQRARSQVGRGTIYHMGSGGIRPHDERPSDAAWKCDCSGFFWWCVGRSRFDGERWWDTTAIHNDAMKHPEGDLFTYHAWDAARPGDALVWGDRPGRDGHDGHQGHIGIVTEVDADGPSDVIHCSAGNYRAGHDAIAETDPGVFKANDAIVARPKWIGA